MPARPDQFDKWLKRYNYLKENPYLQTTVKDKAIIMIVEFQLALEKGNKHFHPETDKELKTLDEILQAFSEFGSIIVQPKGE